MPIEMTKPKDIDVGGVRTRYYDEGAGEPIVMIYGGNFGSDTSAPSATCWDQNFGALAERFRVIALDKLGQGYTGNPKRDEDYTMAAVASHATAFIRALKLPPVHLVGHSRGGYIATRLTLEAQALVRSLTIINSGTLTPGVSTNETVLSRCPHPPYTRESARWIYEGYCFRPETVTDAWVDVVYDVMQQPKHREAVRKMMTEQLGITQFLPALARDKRETLTWLAEGRLQRPAQVVWGFNDKTIAAEYGIDLYNILAAHERRTTLNIFNESGHFPYREHPERFNALMARFVAGASTSEGARS
jgi:pimeloyl-ACP methyl ester carboxylesterase